MSYWLLIDGVWHIDVVMPKAAAMDSRFSYGDGFFSTLGVHGGEPLFLAGHRARIIAGKQAFGFDVDVDLVMAKLRELAQHTHEGMLKIIVIRTSQAVRGYGYTDGCAEVYIKVMPSRIYANMSFMDDIPLQPAIHAVRLASQLSHRPTRLAGIKMIACPDLVFAHAELLERQSHSNNHGDKRIQDGIISNVHGEWISATMGNICYQLGGQWFTPPVHKSGVAGVLRGELLGRQVLTERMLSTDDLSAIDALCTMNAVRGITPVASLDGRLLTGSSPMSLING